MVHLSHPYMTTRKTIALTTVCQQTIDLTDLSANKIYCLLKKDNRWISPCSILLLLPSSCPLFSPKAWQSLPKAHRTKFEVFSMTLKSPTVWDHANFPVFPTPSRDSSHAFIKLVTFPQTPPSSSNTPAFSLGASAHFLPEQFCFLPTACMPIRIPWFPSKQPKCCFVENFP